MYINTTEIQLVWRGRVTSKRHSVVELGRTPQGPWPSRAHDTAIVDFGNIDRRGIDQVGEGFHWADYDHITGPIIIYCPLILVDQSSSDTLFFPVYSIPTYVKDFNQVQRYVRASFLPFKWWIYIRKHKHVFAISIILHIWMAQVVKPNLGYKTRSFKSA